MKRFVWIGVVCGLTVGCGDDGGGGDAASGSETMAADGSGDDGSGSPTSGTPGTGSSGADGGPSTGTPGDSSSGSTAADDSSTGAGAGPTWNNFAMSFFETYCWECHGAGDPLRDYSTIAGIMVESASVRCGTGPASDPPDNCGGLPPPEQFPVGATIPTTDERSMLVEWIDAGLPEG